MSYDDDDEPESFGRKLFFVVLDKLVLAVAIVLVSYWFTQALQKQQMITEYQKSLFEKRLNAYEDLLKSAKAARDECAGFYFSKERSEEELWRSRFAFIEQRAFDLHHGGPSGGGGGGGDIGSESYESVAKALQKVEDARLANGLYMSESVNRKVDEFLNTLLSALDATLQRTEKKQPYDATLEHAAMHKSDQAYEDLRRAIVESLRLKEIILG